MIFTFTNIKLLVVKKKISGETQILPRDPKVILIYPKVLPAYSEVLPPYSIVLPICPNMAKMAKNCDFYIFQHKIVCRQEIFSGETQILPRYPKVILIYPQSTPSVLSSTPNIPKIAKYGLKL